MELSPDTLILLWEKLAFPLIRLLFYISIGLLVANFIEALNWTRKISVLARPLAKAGNMSDTAGASFSLAFFSGISANTLLAEAYDKQQITRRELILANLFNSLPTYFIHLPTIFVITLPLIHGAAFIYIGLTLGAALLRTTSIVIFSRFLLPKRDSSFPDEKMDKPQKVDWHAAFIKSWKRFKKRIKKIVTFTVPIYIIIFIMHRIGIFRDIEQFVAGYLDFLPWLTPQSMGIITLHLAAELTAGLAAAGALLQEGVLSQKEIIMALFVGNIVSSPVRAIRHQFPYYAGIFKPGLAARLIFFSQTFRVMSLVIVATTYYYLVF